MAKYIDTEELIEKLKSSPLCNSLGGMCMQDVIDIIDEMPEKDVAPVIHAHWISRTRFKFLEPLDTMRWFDCSNCGLSTQQDISSPVLRFEHCPRCGAKMNIRS